MNVCCGTCGQEYDIRDPAVIPVIASGSWCLVDDWKCADEAACIERQVHP